jgi:transmembrane sensor
MEELIEQYHSGQISRKDLEQGLKAHWDKMDAPDAQFENHRKEEMWQVIMQHSRQTKVVKIKWSKYAAAAAVVAIMVFIGKQLIKEKSQATATVYKSDVQPGRMGAILELPNGQKIVLDTAANGLLANQSNTSFTKDENGVSIASMNTIAKDAPVEFVKVTVPLKHTQKIFLPDGTTIWLNAGSSIVFPTRFTGNERLVKTTGEIIAKVTYDAKNPFRIETRGTTYEDKGTEFNINAYDDEPVVRITVMEGLVSTKGTLIKAGQQARVNANGQVTVTDNVTQQKLSEIFAWRDEQFSFSGATAEDILKQIAKWYDVEIVYEDRITEEFTISIDRKKPISSLLKSMERSGDVHFEIDGRKIIVRK